MKRTAVWVVGVGLLGLVAGNAQAFQGSADRGRMIFSQRCAMCHGVDGSGNNGMAADFTSEWYRLTKSDAELKQNIRNGYSTPGKAYGAGMMPPQVLNDRDMDDVLAFLRQAFMQ